MFTERRSCVRHKVNGPVFASFDGVTGGMILDLSEGDVINGVLETELGNFRDRVERALLRPAAGIRSWHDTPNPEDLTPRPGTV